LNSTKSIIVQNTKKASDLETKSKQIKQTLSATSSNDEIAKLELNLSIEGDLLTKKESSFDLVQSKLKATSLKTSLESDHKKVHEMNSKLKNLENQQVVIIKLKELNEEKNSMETSLWKLMETLKGVISTSDPSKVVSNLTTLISTQENLIQTTNKSITSLESQKMLLSEKKRVLDETLVASLKTLEEKEASIKRLCKDRPWEYVFTKCENEVGVLLKDTGLLESVKVCYERFLKEAEQVPKCPVCDRGLNQDELVKFVKLQTDKLKEAPEALINKKKELAKYQNLSNQLRELKPVVADIAKLKSLHIEMQAKREVTETDLKQMEVNRTQMMSLETLQKDLKMYKDHAQVANKISNQYEQIVSIQEKIHMEKEKMNQFELDGNTDQLIQSRDSLLISIETLQREFDVLNNKNNNFEKETNNLRQSIMKKQTELNSLNSVNEKSKRDMEQLERYKIEVAELEKTNMELNTSLPPLQVEISNLKSKLEVDRKENEGKEVSAQSLIDEYQRHHATLTSCFKDLQKFQNEGKSTLLLETREKITKLQIKALERNTLITTYTSELESITEQISSKNRISHNLEENVHLRTTKKQLVLLNQSITNVTNEIKQLSPLDETKVAKLNELFLKNTKQHSELIGTKKAIQSEMESIQKDLKKEEYQEIDEKYKFAVVKLKTVEKATVDLEKYYNALNQALMKYHSMKMAEINEIIKELWQKTYRGQDIDTIEIRAEVGTTGRQNYNYRVVLLKGNIALDMRGRCSAGQKVLACLIIRLALAEAFCVECGIIALDEPTTNLDSENVSSLAQSLQLIIGEREKQSNFQLIVITHDEDFVQKIGRASFVDKFYRVSKDSETQTSRITEHAFVENK
jgi:DNA repair protein RAD50